MRFDPRQLAGQRVEFLVVGGGIQGAALARELALRGRSVVLVEREDYGCGTSMRSSRLIHGGVRYLEQGHLRLVYEALHERERLLRLAPHLVRPLPMLMPFYAGAGRSPFLLKLGLRIYSWLAGRSTLPRPVAHGVDGCLRVFPGLRRAGLRGGVVFYDAATEDLRLTLAVLHAAARAGARLCNHTEVVGLAAGGVVLRDHVAGGDVTVRAEAILNATGAHVDRLRARLGVDAAPLVRVSRGSHLVLPPMGEVETALGAFLADGRIQFVVPHRHGVVCGTTEVDEVAATDTPDFATPDADYVLAALGKLLEVPPQRGDVRFAYTGWRALPAAKGPAGQLNREAFLHTEACSAGLLHTAVGGKLTTHRAYAERTVNRLLGRKDPSPSRSEPLPGGEGPHEPLDPLWWRHGSNASAVRALADGDPEVLAPFAEGRDLLGAEIAWAVQREGAVTFTDLMLRRLFQVQGPPTEPEAVARAFALFARFRPARLPALDADAEHAAFAAAVRAMAGPFAPSFDAPTRPRA